ncbi:MAG: ABC transporter permease [Candidatus Dormibacteria bacterium]
MARRIASSLGEALGRDVSLPLLALVVVFVAIIVVQSSVLSYFGIGLLLSAAVPLVFATIAQGLVIGLSDIDLGVGYGVGLTNAICAGILASHFGLGLLCLVCFVAGYAALGALISVRRVPAIVITLGASFIWLGLGENILPTPGGSAPGWLATIYSANTPLLPLPLWLVIVAAGAAYLVLFRTRLGLMLRGYGSNQDAYVAAGWSRIRVRMLTYACAAVFLIIAGLTLTGLTESGDPTGSANYTLLSVAGVILGGGAFSGGRISAIGMICGALVMSLIGSLLGLLSIAPSFATGAEGVVMLAVIAGRRFWSRENK